MSPVAGAGALYEPLDELAALLSAGAAFRTWTGTTGDASAALAKVHPVAVEPPSAARPWALIVLAPGGTFGRRASKYVLTQGAAHLVFESDVPDLERDEDTGDVASLRDSLTAFGNSVAGIMGQFAEAAGNSSVATNYRLRTATLAVPPRVTSMQEQTSMNATATKPELYMECVWRLTFGLGG